MGKQQLLLASQSPRRKEILLQLGVNFRQIDVNVEETPKSNELPANYVCRLAEAKARAGLLLNPQSVVLGADTIVVCDDQILEKPQSEVHAKTMLRKLSGRSHEVLSAVCMVSAAECLVELSVTQVQFVALSDELIDRYWRTKEGLDKAGSYAIQGRAAAFVKSISGSYSGVVGLPIEKVVPMLAYYGIDIWLDSQPKGAC